MDVVSAYRCHCWGSCIVCGVELLSMAEITLLCKISSRRISADLPKYGGVSLHEPIKAPIHLAELEIPQCCHIFVVKGA